MANQNSLSKYRGLFFSIGIVVALFAVWQVLSWKTFVSNSALEDKVRLRDLKQDFIIPPQIPPKPATPPKEKRPRKDKDLLKTFEISLLDDIPEDELWDDESPETPDFENFTSADLWDESPDSTDFVPLWNLDRLPIFKGCEHLEGNMRDACLQNEIRQFVGKNFNPKVITPFPNQRNDVKLFVSFTVLENGKIGLVEVVNHQTVDQQREAERVLKAMPEFQPALFNGKPVKTKLKLPIHLRRL